MFRKIYKKLMEPHLTELNLGYTTRQKHKKIYPSKDFRAIYNLDCNPDYNCSNLRIILEYVYT